ncbi:MAG: carboxyl transferase domain-containing protein [Christensenellaceae bacterium]
MGKLEELRQKNKDALLSGGEEHIQAQKNAGKKTARERVSGLLDADSFVEIDKFVKRTYVTPGFDAPSATGEGVVCGYGTIDERAVFLFAQDYTVLSGSLSVAHAAKILKAIDMAVKNGVPVLAILDSGGARVSEGIAAIDSYAAILKKLNDVSGVIPTISIVAGACVGAAAYIAATTDFTLMVDKISVMALHGPQIYASALGKSIDENVSFGAQNHAKNTGIAQFACATEDECFAVTKKLLSFLPSNNLEEAPYQLCADDLNRQLEVFNTEGAYDAKALIAAVCDNTDMLEQQADFASEIVTAFGRINGNVVGFIANAKDAVITGHAARKAARFALLLDAYNIPIVTFTNCEGTSFDESNEHGMLIADVTKLISAYAEIGVPKINVIVGKAIGDGFAMMCPKSLGADMVYAWPFAQISSIPAKTGALIMFEEEINNSKEPLNVKEQMEKKYIELYANPWQAAAQGVVDDVIEPAHTRQMLVSALEMSISKRENKLPKKHSVLPL